MNRRRHAAGFTPPSDRADYLAAVMAVSQTLGLPAGDFAFAGRRVCGRFAPGPRKLAHLMAVYLTVTARNVRMARAARAAGINRSNVSRLCREAEDRRDRPEFDALVSQAEALMEGL